MWLNVTGLPIFWLTCNFPRFLKLLIDKSHIWLNIYLHRLEQSCFLYSVKFWLNMLGSNRGCLSVCLCVCVCVCVSSLQPKRMIQFWRNFPKMISRIFARSVFLGFWNFEIDDVMAAILYFFYAALSRSHFLSDFLQNSIQGTLLCCGVCYWKSAKSVGNFRHYRRLRVRSEIMSAIFDLAGHWYALKPEVKNKINLLLPVYQKRHF